jgi:hypothetical protein
MDGDATAVLCERAGPRFIDPNSLCATVYERGAQRAWLDILGIFRRHLLPEFNPASQFISNRHLGISSSCWTMTFIQNTCSFSITLLNTLKQSSSEYADVA